MWEVIAVMGVLIAIAAFSAAAGLASIVNEDAWENGDNE